MINIFKAISVSPDIGWYLKQGKFVLTQAADVAGVDTRRCLITAVDLSIVAALNCAGFSPADAARIVGCLQPFWVGITCPTLSICFNDFTPAGQAPNHYTGLATRSTIGVIEEFHPGLLDSLPQGNIPHGNHSLAVCARDKYKIFR